MQENCFKFIDLFAGIGGFHIAMSNLGGECVFASEWDEDCRKVYSHNFSESSKYIFNEDGTPNENFCGDITMVEPNNIPEHDVLCAGFPCQPFSQAGYKKGFEDTRGTLFFNVASIIKAKRPKVILMKIILMLYFLLMKMA
jgi:DNA (cytosine-5)-methyltransferase 1